MYTYIKDNELFILIPITGRIYKIRSIVTDLQIIHVDTLSFEADVIQHIKENNAILLRE